MLDARCVVFNENVKNHAKVRIITHSDHQARVMGSAFRLMAANLVMMAGLGRDDVAIERAMLTSNVPGDPLLARASRIIVDGSEYPTMINGAIAKDSEAI